jgi:ATP-dependent helicase Lhr and Lhr-like helicase
MQEIKHLFHKSVYNWFEESFSQISDIQRLSWPEIKKNNHVLISAPTGSGKTLASFLAGIDDLVKLAVDDKLENQNYIVYISPLKALSNDIHKNLQLPLEGIFSRIKEEFNLEVNPIRIAVRSGDTSQKERQAIKKNIPHILVTTPESLYILLTSKSGRNILSTTKTVIIDEIHALINNKRGSHLSLSLERLEHLSENKLVRIGLSATQKPIKQVARYLVGNRDDECKILETGKRRHLDISIAVPETPLSAVMSLDTWDEIHQKLISLIESHTTTLIFVNTRRLAERLSHSLAKIVGEEHIATHHGSMSKELRLDAEERLKNGSIKAMVATASLELGIDIGSIDLVIQISTAKMISTFLQRIGRSRHYFGGTPKGIIFPISRDELIESMAMLNAVKSGELDHIVMPEKPLDILAQQIVAELANEDFTEENLYKLITNSYVYRELEKKEFEEILETLNDGYSTRFGRKRAYIFWDKINQELKGRKNARLTSLLSGGAIPDQFDYDVILDPEGVYIGNLNEDFAIESMAGDIFKLGNNTWQITRVENSKVRVIDAHGQPPTIPFWLGEAPGRSDELSDFVSDFRIYISEKLDELSYDELKTEIVKDFLITEYTASQVLDYLATIKAAFGFIPNKKKIALERFFDDANDMHLVIHSPYGSRINRAWGLALRKRFCRKFNFELQAAASEESIILSLGSTHSFPIEEIMTYLSPDNVRDILIQAMLDSPMFEVRWRWNATRALAVQRRRGNQRMPAQIQRSQAEDLIALIFPDQIACLENISGNREVPDHPLVQQTINDCLHEAMDIDGLEHLLASIKNGEVEVQGFDLVEPSPLSHEIINSKPYTYLDDAPLEERRTRALQSRVNITAEDAKNLSVIDEEAILKVKEEIWPLLNSVDELYEAMSFSAYFCESELTGKEKEYFSELVDSKRATILSIDDKLFYISADRYHEFISVFPKTAFSNHLDIPARMTQSSESKEKIIIEIVRNRFELLGPVSETEFLEKSPFTITELLGAFYALESEGFIFQGSFIKSIQERQWCERRLLSRIHRYSIKRKRKSQQVYPKSLFMHFLFYWNHILSFDGDEKTEEDFLQAIEQLEGYETAAYAWENDILRLRFPNYNNSWIDLLSLNGQILWGSFDYGEKNLKQKKKQTIKSSPITIINRQYRAFWHTKRLLEYDELSHYAKVVYEYLEHKGACYISEITAETELLNEHVESGISELAANSYISSDAFNGLRSLITNQKTKNRHYRRFKKSSYRLESQKGGRWFVLENKIKETNSDERIKYFIDILFKRYGLLFKNLVYLEKNFPSWYGLLPTLRRMESRGEILGGRFIDGVWGEQFALAEAIGQMKRLKNEENTEESFISISASDPLNLSGLIDPPFRIGSISSNRILYKDGKAIASLENDEMKLIDNSDDLNEWEIKNLLSRNQMVLKNSGNKKSRNSGT